MHWWRCFCCSAHCKGLHVTGKDILHAEEHQWQPCCWAATVQKGQSHAAMEPGQLVMSQAAANAEVDLPVSQGLHICSKLSSRKPHNLGSRIA